MTLSQVIKSSQKYFQSIDNKALRASTDIIGARLIRQHNYQYDRQEQIWKQTGTFSKFIYGIRSRPTSYKSDGKVHKYPLVFWIKNASLGLESPFRYRCGSLKKPVFASKGANKAARERVASINRKNQIEFDFFFNLEWALHKQGILYGPNWAAYAPKNNRNVSQIPYFCKHAWYALQVRLMPVLISSLANPKKAKRTGGVPNAQR